MNILTKDIKYFLLILFIGTLVYFPILFNGFVWDDILLILNNPEVHEINMQLLFGANVFNAGIFYRPLHALYVATLYTTFGHEAFMYHALQLALHIFNSCALFLLFRIHFKNTLAFMLALIFLIHPINVETVAWISATNNQLYFFFGIVALLIATKKTLTMMNIILIGSLLLLSVLAKETGFLFMVIIFMYRLINKLGQYKIIFLTAFLIGSIYIILRDVFANVTNSTNLDHIIPIYSLPLSERIMSTPAIIFYYLNTFFYPVKLGILQSWIVSKSSLGGYLLPSLLISIFFLFFSYCLYKMRKNALAILFLFYLLWYVLGMAPLLQIIPLNMTVAERWFYFPIVGLIGMLGLSMQLLMKVTPRYGKIYFIIGIIVISLLSIRSYYRTFDWKDNKTLYGRDLQQQPENYMLSDEYVKELLQFKKYDEAVILAYKSAQKSPTIDRLNRLGYIYQSRQQYDDAFTAYRHAIKLAYTGHFVDTHNKDAIKLAYENLAAMFVIKKDYDQASSFLRAQALKKYPEDVFFYLLLAISEANLKNKEAAITAAQDGFRLSGDASFSLLISHIQNDRPISLGKN